MTCPLVVIDDACEDPDAVRAHALSLTFDQSSGLFPGRFAYHPAERPPLLDLAERHLGRPLEATGFFADKEVFAIVTLRGDELVPAQRIPHFDHQFCDIVCLLYLNLPEQCAGGTSFWRHRESDLVGVPEPGDPRVRRLMAEAGVRDERLYLRQLWARVMERPAPGYLTESNDVWKLERVVEMRYNRLLLFDARLFHTTHVLDGTFGETLETRRLTQNAYFRYRC